MVQYNTTLGKILIRRGETTIVRNTKFEILRNRRILEVTLISKNSTLNLKTLRLKTLLRILTKPYSI